MKKYTLFLFVFTLFVISLGFSDKSASAANCALGDLFNTTTGQACAVATVLNECKDGDLFSSVTGQPCPGIYPSTSGTLDCLLLVPGEMMSEVFNRF